VNNYAYYIYGVGHHTEENCRSEDAFMQVYRPLYEEAYAYRNGGLFDLRPLHMFFDPADWKGKTGAAVYKDRRPDVICAISGDQGPYVSEPLAASNDQGMRAGPPWRRTSDEARNGRHVVGAAGAGWTR